MVRDILRAEPLINRALAKGSGTHTYEDIAEDVLKGDSQLWMGKDSCMVTQVLQLPQKRRLHIMLGSGDLNELLEMVEEELIPFAKANNCKDMSLVGRKGWKKVLSKSGWSEDYVSLYRGLE